MRIYLSIYYIQIYIYTHDIWRHCNFFLDRTYRNWKQLTVHERDLAVRTITSLACEVFDWQSWLGASSHPEQLQGGDISEIQIISQHFRLSRHGIRALFCHGQPRELFPDSNRSRWTSHVSIPFARMLWWLAESVMSLAGSLAVLLFGWGKRNLCKMGSRRFVSWVLKRQRHVLTCWYRLTLI